MRHPYRGFTLIELLASLALCAVIMLFGAVSLSERYQKNQLDRVCERIESILKVARTEALIRGEPVRLEPLSESGHWNKGIVLLTHRQSEPIYQWCWTLRGISVDWQGFQSKAYLIVAPDLRHAASNGQFTLNHKHWQYRLVVNRLGRVKETLISIPGNYG